jgi:hypothetical protein
MLDRTEFELVVEHAQLNLCGKSPVAECAVLLLSLSTFTEPSGLGSIELDSSRQFFLTSVQHLAETKVDQCLHSQVGDSFARPAVPAAIIAFELLKTLPPVSDSALNVYLKTVTPRATVARLRSFLLFTGSAVYGYPPVLAMTGLYPHASKVPAPRSYIRLDHRHWAQSLEYLHLFDPKFGLPSPDQWPEPCGSSFVPQTWVVRDLVAAINEILDAPGSTDLDEEFRNLNAIASILTLLWCLFAGARLWPTELPVILFRHGVCLGHEKIKSIYTWPKPLRSLHAWYLRRRFAAVGAAAQAGLAVKPRDMVVGDLTSLVLSDTGHMTTLPICARHVTEGLLAHPRTIGLAAIYPPSMRHFSMTELYAAGEFAHEDIEAFHHRSMLQLSPLGTECMEDPRMPRIRNRMSEYLALIIGL